MFHVHPETLRRHPILGVLIGVGIVVAAACMMRLGWTEVRALIGQKAPAVVTLHDAVHQQGTRWITVSDGQWHCEDLVTIPRKRTFERRIRGPIAATEVPVTSGESEDLLIARFKGKLSCEERAGTSLTGVVGSTEIFTSRGAIRRWSRTGRPVAVLNVGASPTQALLMFLGIGALMLVGVAFFGYYLRKMLPSPEEDRRAHPPLTQPIEPR